MIKLKGSEGRWAYCCWEELYEWLAGMQRSEEQVIPGLYFIPPPIVDITFHDGLWSELNRSLGTMFDIAEEEEIGPDLLFQTAVIISDFVKRYDDSNEIRVVQVATQIWPRSEPVIAQIPMARLRYFLLGLVDFLVKAKHLEKTVIISL